MNSLIDEYDGYLRRQAQQPIRDRLKAFQSVLATWAIASILGITLVQTCVRVLGATPWILIPLLALFVVGASWTTARFNRHGMEFDRTPICAAWTATQEGQILIRALRRVTLNILRDVTTETRLMEDLRLTRQDLSELFVLLKREVGLESDVVEGRRQLTVGELLDVMQKTVQGGTGSTP